MLALGLILDAALGEPEWIWRRVPHPAVLFGRLVDWLERRMNAGGNRRVKGALVVLALVLAAAIPATVLSWEGFGGVFEVLGAAVLLAQRSLADHVRGVAQALHVSLERGRDAVARIVGRDPETLDRSGVARAAIESAAENFADGVVAPAFWFLVAGLPGMAVYKAVNTADSMIGHRSARYREFGWAAARLDDVLSWIPSRLAGAAICLVGGGRMAWEVMRRDARRHRSPNAGWPEAAMAASLGVALAGPRSYGGTVTEDPSLNAAGRRTLDPQDIEDAVALVWRAWGVVLGAATVVSLTL